MPRKSKPGTSYPPDWKAIATAVKEAAGWRCIRCGASHENRPGYTLTIHHLDMDPSHSDPERYWWNLLPLCCICHLQIQHKVVLHRPWVMTEHSEWFRPYVAGWYAVRYLGEFLSRDQVLARLDELLALERRVVLGVAS
jgi:hypothetical protein